MKLGKWKIELAIVVLLATVGLGKWWSVATKDDRAAEAQYEQLVRLANRQSVEIAIIEQTSKLANYRQQIAAAQQSVRPNPPVPVEEPFTIDPEDVKVK